MCASKNLSHSHVLWKLLLKMMMWEREISGGVAVGGGVYVRNVRRSEERCEINEIKIAVGYENKYIHILEEILCSRFIFPPLSTTRSPHHHHFHLHHTPQCRCRRRPMMMWDIQRKIIWLLRQDSTAHHTGVQQRQTTQGDRHGSSSNGSLIWIFDYH